MQNSGQDRIGCVVRVHMLNGLIFTGTVLMWDEAVVYLSTVSGELVEITRTQDISAVVYIVKKDGNLLREDDLKKKNAKPQLMKEQKEESKEQEKPSDQPTTRKNELVERVKSLAELQKLKAISEREAAKAKLKTSHATAKPVEYHDPISILQSFKNNIRNKG